MGLKRILVIIAYLLTTILLLDRMISKESPSEEFIVRGLGREEGSGERERGDEDGGQVRDRKRARWEGGKCIFPLVFL